MTEKKPQATSISLNEGYQALEKGYQAVPMRPHPQGGHQATTSDGSGGQQKLPSGGSSENN